MPIDFLLGEPTLLDDRFPLPRDRPFTTAQASAAGVRDRVLTRLVRSGYLRRPLKGVYVACQVPDSRSLRAQIISAVAPPGSVVSDWTACWFWTGIDQAGSHEASVPLNVVRFRGHERLRNGLVASGQRWFRPSDVRPLNGNVMISTPLRTALDLGRFAPRITALGGMDALARMGDFAVERLVDDVSRFDRQRGVVQLRMLAPLVDPRAESPGESALRLRWLECPEMPPPELQVAVRIGDTDYRLDLGVEELRFGVEYDGEQWHSTPADRIRDVARRTALEAQAGYLIDVFRRQHVFGQHEIASVRLPRAVVEARLRLSGVPGHVASRQERWRG